MIHYVFDTHQRLEARRPCRTLTSRLAYERLCLPGRHSIPVPGFESEVLMTDAGCFCLIIEEATRHPAMAVGIAESDGAAGFVWPAMHRFRERLRTRASSSEFSEHHAGCPMPAPWFATLTMFADPNSAVSLSQFCRELAWTWVTRSARS